MGSHIDRLKLEINLLRLPLVVINEVFQNMDFQKKFLISLLSKRARKTLKLTSVPAEFSFHLSNSLHIRTGSSFLRSGGTSEESYCIEGEEMKLKFHLNGVIPRSESPHKHLLFCNHMLDTFKSITVSFLDKTLPSTAWEFMKMAKKVSIKSFNYCATGDSSEFIPRILDECTEVTDSITICVRFPDDFFYIPPRPFKATEFYITRNTNWFNLESFLSCRNVIIELIAKSNRTRQTYESFFNKWMDSDVRLERLTFSSTQPSENHMIMQALHNQGNLWIIDDEWIEMNRSNGSDFFINHSLDYIHIYTKERYKRLKN
uniref:F-box domain-containing protein n=1 Tax=Caenorhabditis tropicalis TaxID=1561998 RepID=A0A1I7UTR4_9PELO